MREQERAFVVEGVRAVEDALAVGGRPRLLLVRDGATWMPAAKWRSIVRVADERTFKKAAETESPQSILGVFDVPHLPKSSQEPFAVIADGISDPGNLGTLLRSAAGAGATVFAVTPGTVDPFNGKVVRAAMGAHFRIPMVRITPGSLASIARDIPIRVLAEMGGEVDYAAFDYRGPMGIIVGLEANGPSEIGTQLATSRVRITLDGGVESLNAAVAGSILLFEAARQRRTSVMLEAKSLFLRNILRIWC